MKKILSSQKRVATATATATATPKKVLTTAKKEQAIHVLPSTEEKKSLKVFTSAKEQRRKLLATCQKVAEGMKRTFVAALFQTIAVQENVKISLPSLDAKYLTSVKGHRILVFADDNFSKLLKLDVPDHYVHGDCPKRNAEGQVKPQVVRHFFVLPTFFGQDIVATVTVKEKTCLLTGEKMVIIDIDHQVEAVDTSMATHSLQIGVPCTGAENEAKISESGLCVRFKPLKKKMELELN